MIFAPIFNYLVVALADFLSMNLVKIFFLVLLMILPGYSFCQDISQDNSVPSQRLPGYHTPAPFYPYISPPLGWLGDIAFVGQDIWVGGGTGWIYKISSQTGQLLDSMDTHLNVAIDGITYGNNALWVAQSYNGNLILKIDPVTKTILQTLTNPVASQFTHGMLFHNNQLWINMFWFGTINSTYVLDTLCHIVTSYPNHAYYSHGIAFDGLNFWITANQQPPNNDEYLFRFDQNFQLLDSMPLPGGEYPNGLAYYGGCLWLANADSLNIYIMCELTAGITPFEASKKSVDIFPVPVEREMNVRFSDPEVVKRVEFFSPSGNLLLVRENDGRDLITIPVSEFNCSFLIVRIVRRDESYDIRKVILMQ